MYKSRIDNLDKLTEKFGINWADSSILDIGFGNGYFEEYYRQEGVKRLFGLDVNTSTIEEVRKKFPEYKFEVIDVTEMDLNTKEAFDIATMFAVLYHIVDDNKLMKAFKQINEALKPCGTFLISGDLYNWNAMPQTCSHFKSRTLEQTQSILRESGFKVIATMPVTHFLNAPYNLKNKFFRNWFTFSWRGFTWLITRTEATGWLGGAMAYYIDRLLMPFLKVGLSENIIIAQKIEAQ